MKTIYTVVLSLILINLSLTAQTQIGQDIDGEAAWDSSGRSVSLSSNGSIVAIGAPGNDENGSHSGHVRVFENQSGTWVQLGDDIDGEAEGNRSGKSVSLSSDGSIVAIGADINNGNGDSSGHVRVYENQSGTWTQLGDDINGEAAYDFSGTSVSLSSDGQIVAIGAHGNKENGQDSGHVRVYKNMSGTWVQLGGDIDGEAAGDYSGVAVNLSSDGTIVAIGATWNSGKNGSYSGHVRVYVYQFENWTQIGQDIDGEAGGDNSGSVLSLNNDGNIVAIGADQNSGNGTNSGHVRVFENQSGTWVQLGGDIDGKEAYERSGRSVSLNGDGTIVAVGVHGNMQMGSQSGIVRTYKNISGSWIQNGVDIEGEFDPGEYIFYSNVVSLSTDGATLGIGTLGNDGNGIESGHVRVYDTTTTLNIRPSTIIADISIYPNPTVNQIYIKSNLAMAVISIYDVNGRLLNTKTLSSPKIDSQIDTSYLSKGLYFIEIQTGKSKQHYKIIKK